MGQKLAGRSTACLACSILAAGILGIGLLAGAYMFTSWGRPAPTVEILQPRASLAIESGDIVVLVARGQSSLGIQRIEFLADDIPINAQSARGSPQRGFEAAFPWFSSQPGVHKLSVIARDRAGSTSAPSAVLVVVSARQAQATPQENAVGGATGSAGSSGGEGQPSGDQDADGAGSTPAQLPAGIDMNGAFPVDLPDQPADLPPAVTEFRVQTGSAGDSIQVSIIATAEDDLGIGYIAFSLANLDRPLDAESTSVACGGAAACHATQTYTIPVGGWILSARAVDSSGQASAVRSTQLYVLEGGDPAAWGEEDDALIPVGSVEAVQNEELMVLPSRDDIGQPRIAEYLCDGHAIVLELIYMYQSDHGQSVVLGARATKDGRRIAEGTTVVGQTSSGQTPLEMTVFESGVTTDQLELFFVAGNDYFYTETANLQITWPEPKADLRVSHADAAEGLAQADVENIGCAAVDGFDIRLTTLEGEVFEHVDGHLGPRETQTWTTLVDPNLLSRGFKISVDPAAEIAEINEDNNGYDVEPITLQYVQIYQIDILDTHDEEWTESADQGEFDLWFWIGEGISGRRPRVREWLWDLPLGSWEIGGFVAPIIESPALQWNQDLYVTVHTWEYDWAGVDPVCDVTLVVSHDMWQEQNWKKGGDFSATDPGRCTIHVRVVSE